MRRYVIAPDSFKGTMTSREICDLIEAVILEVDPGAIIDKIPIADGGEGLVDAFLAMSGGQGRRIETQVTGPRFATINSFYGLFAGQGLISGPEETAIIEMAAAAGLPLLAAAERNPAETTTVGVGELILEAVAHGAKNIIVGLGGSATNDGGIGLAHALGYRFYDQTGAELVPVGGNLVKIALIKAPATPMIPPSIVIEAACDVNNPMFGPQGAAFIFAPQKGADPAMVIALDRGLMNLADRIEADLGLDVRQLPGGGAAGGLGAGLVAFLGATLRPGIELLLDAVNFDQRVCQADYVFTGEGRMDGQSLAGKAPVGIARRARRYNVPVIGVVGSLGQDVEALYDVGFTTVISTIRDLASLEDTLRQARPDLAALVKSLVRLIVAKDPASSQSGQGMP
jgi:glycerate kinase